MQEDIIVEITTKLNDKRKEKSITLRNWPKPQE